MHELPDDDARENRHDEPMGGHPMFPRPETETGPDLRRIDLIHLERYTEECREMCPIPFLARELRSWAGEYGGRVEVSPSMLSLRLTTPLLSALLACGATPATTGCDPASPPHVVRLSAVPPVVHPTEVLKIVALVDSNYRSGSVRLGGIVEDGAGNVYGALDDSGYSSTLTSELAWSTIDEVSALSFTKGAELHRAFSLELDENDLHAPFHSDPLDVTFACTAPDDATRFGLCNTRCTDFDSTDHCGACATACSAGQVCSARRCVPGG